MRQFPRVFAVVLFLGLLLRAGPALGKNHSDTASPSGRYRVRITWHGHAPTPENQYSSEDYKSVCVDTSTGQTLWTQQHKNVSAGPSDVFVSDDGWTMICQLGCILTPVDRTGKEGGEINVLKQFSASENKQYVQDVMDAPPQWGKTTLWYFLDAEGGHYFIVRPWWGHHLVIDLARGRTVSPSRPVEAAIAGRERADILTQLAKGADTFKTWETDCCPPAAIPVCTAAYLAGSLHLFETIPLLRRLEPCTYSSRGGGGTSYLDNIKSHDGEIDPEAADDFSLRQIVQLSLRRLGQVPSPLPGVSLERRFVDYKRDQHFLPTPPTVARTQSVDSIRKGQTPEQVLALLGGPDLVDSPRWEYDLDTDPARTLTISWENYRVKDFEWKKPAAWQRVGEREKLMLY